jgi:hypothetical protein
MKKLAAYLFIASLVPFGARAADGTLAVTPGTGATIVVSPSGSDIVPHSIPCDRTTVSQCIAIDSTGHIATQAPANATGIAGSNASAPLAAQMMVSDGTNLQRVLAPLILGDGVNGNNMLADGLWGFNGTTWDRLQVDGSKQLKVVLPTGAATSALQTTGNTALTTINTTLGTPMQATGGTVTVVVPTTIPFHALSAASNNCTNVKNAAGTLWEIHVTNTNTSGVYDLRLYNKASAPVPSTDSALVTDNIAIPLASAAGVYGGIVVSFPAGRSFSSGIGFCLTGLIADNDNTSATTGVQINGTYQ